MKCPYCDYEWDARVESPKRCPKCQKWLPYPPRYEMRFVPYVKGTGRLKRGAPKVGGRGGIEDGDIVLLPLECRWEEYWELVNEEDVPEEELTKDQNERDAFMVKARADEAERAKQLRPVGVPIA